MSVILAGPSACPTNWYIIWYGCILACLPHTSHIQHGLLEVCALSLTDHWPSIRHHLLCSLVPSLERLETVTQMVKMLIIKILEKFLFVYFEKWWSDQLINLHMPQQFSCCDMCKILACLGVYFGCYILYLLIYTPLIPHSVQYSVHQFCIAILYVIFMIYLSDIVLYIYLFDFRWALGDGYWGNIALKFLIILLSKDMCLIQGHVS